MTSIRWIPLLLLATEAFVPQVGRHQARLMFLSYNPEEQQQQPPQQQYYDPQQYDQQQQYFDQQQYDPQQQYYEPQQQYDQQQYEQQQQPQEGTEEMMANMGELERFIYAYYPSFHFLLTTSEDEALKVLRDSSNYCTIFAPLEEVFQKMGEKKVAQLGDPRNMETAMKIAAYHVVNEAVSAEELFDSGGVITLGGTVPIDRKVRGGFLGIGGQEDGSVTINGANVMGSYQVGNGIIHEVDELISPQMLFRYLDQLRIPGSK